MKPHRRNTIPGFWALSLGGLAFCIAAFVWLWNASLQGDVPSNAYHGASRMINGAFGACMISIVLIVTLVSNLYTPRLVKLLVRHPFVIGGLIFTTMTNLLIVLGDLISPTHPLHHNMLFLVFSAIILSAAGLIPFLYFISQFLRPSYFLPVLRTSALKNLRKIRGNAHEEKYYSGLFENIDIIANIALTAANRDDRQLMGLSLRMLHEILLEMISKEEGECSRWRKTNHRFLTGISLEGRDFLAEETTWPEAYLLGSQLRVLRGIPPKQNEVQAESCQQLRDSLTKAIDLGNWRVADLHRTLLNSYMRLAIDKRDLERYQGLSYTYRLILDAECARSEDLHPLAPWFASWEYYAFYAHDRGLTFGCATTLYDSGNLLINLSRKNEQVAIDVLGNFVAATWKLGVGAEGRLQRAALRVVVQTYWKAKAAGNELLASEIERRFLPDAEIHARILDDIFSKRTGRHSEFNDRFLRFTYLPDNVLSRCQSFHAEHSKTPVMT